MTTPQRFLDVWIVETNTVYKEVPFAVVTDWLQQGRLLEDDQAKPSGTKDWQRLGAMADFRPYLLQPEPLRPDDQAEAMEPIDFEFTYNRPHDEEDEDVDMIPLIDVSLVLLVFFMLTASSIAMAGYVETPQTEHGLMADSKDALRIDITRDTDDSPLFSLGVGDKPAEEDEKELRTLSAVLDRLRARLAKTPAGVDLVINADKELKAKVARDLLLALRVEPFRSKLTTNYYGVSEKKEP